MNYHQSNADKAAKTAEMNMLLRGKTSEQEAIIRFFYGAQGGCLSKGGISLRQYLEKVEAKLASLDTKQKDQRQQVCCPFCGLASPVSS